MEDELSVLPLWWAEDGDAVIVNDVDEACKFAESLRGKCHLPQVTFIDWHYGYDRLCRNQGREYIPCPWGWSKAAADRFRRFGVPDVLMPSEKALSEWRMLSNRKFAAEYAAELLRHFDACGSTVRLAGRGMTYYENLDDCRTALPIGNKVIFKSPWSSSGRGVFVASDICDEKTDARLRGFLRTQGGFVADRFYEKCLDFAMEYEVKENGSVNFLGYSVFTAAESGKYGYNAVGSQPQLRKMIDDAVAGNIKGGDQDEAVRLIDKIAEYNKKALSQCLGGTYSGPVGIDMLVAKEKGRTVVHPCIEINMRMNMGILAIHLSRFLDLAFSERLPLFADLPAERSSRGMNLYSPISIPLTPIRSRGFNARLEAGRFMLSFS